MLLLAGQDQNAEARLFADYSRAVGAGLGVRVVPSPSEPVKYLLFSSADIFASPVDSIQESFGLAVLEAMAYGLPAVVSDWSGYRDIVAQDETGLLLPTLIDQVPDEWRSLLPLVDPQQAVASSMASRSLLKK
jgi:glycosyltransferase involved in cell wall biosynthesis